MVLVICCREEYRTKSDTLERIPCILWIEFDDPTVGKEKRAESEYLYFRNKTIQRNWSPIALETRRFQIGKGVSGDKIVRKQFPFIVVHIEMRMSRIGLYTVLSRAKSASGLYVVGNLKLINKLSEKAPVYMET